MTRHLVVTLVLDTAVTVALFAVWLVVTARVQPTEVGFFCDDTTIVYPYTAGTIGFVTLLGVGFGFPIVSFIIVEFGLGKWLRTEVFDNRGWSAKVPQSCINMYHLLITFISGFFTTFLITDLGKYGVGRLRPHFLAVCQPVGFNCSSDGLATSRYVAATAYTCNASGFTDADVSQARQSFPSGHASISFFCMIYLVLYLQARISWPQLRMLRSFLQIVAFSLAWLCAQSRVVDYWHHWSDVVCGSVLGAAVACYYVCGVLRLLHLPSLQEIEKAIVRNGCNCVEVPNAKTPLLATSSKKYNTAN